MKNVVLTGLIVALTGCATQHHAAGQNYRLKGADDAINIQGKLNYSEFTTDDYVDITFNGVQQIKVKLDPQFFGEATGTPYQGKQTSASCTGKALGYSTEVRCMVFVDNEKTVTLTF
jgi:hypothetical protein